jgi:hypothetical protein
VDSNQTHRGQEAHFQRNCPQVRLLSAYSASPTLSLPFPSGSSGACACIRTHPPHVHAVAWEVGAWHVKLHGVSPPKALFGCVRGMFVRSLPASVHRCRDVVALRRGAPGGAALTRWACNALQTPAEGWLLCFHAICGTGMCPLLRAHALGHTPPHSKWRAFVYGVRAE